MDKRIKVRIQDGTGAILATIRATIPKAYRTKAEPDSAVALGYTPESWDGMWKLPAEEFPILWLTRNWALVHEVVYEPGTHRAVLNRHGDRVKKRWHLRRTPRP